MKKSYYRIKFNNASSLNVGGNENIVTDKDLIRDGSGKPYIPGTSLAGVYRGAFLEDEADRLFGSISMDNDSSIITYDATIIGDYSTSYRDMVSIDREYGVARKGMKFDFEVLEPGAQFITYLEVNDSDAGDVIASRFLSNDFTFGSKTSRGLGAIENVEIKKIVFNLPEDKDKWNSFDVYNDARWIDAAVFEETVETDKNVYCFDLLLKQISPLLIRTYSTEVSDDEKISLPDSIQLSFRKGDKQIPIIPGTSWAGVFRHRMSQLNPDHSNLVFGMNDDENGNKDEDVNDGKHIKSRITFSESQLENCKYKTVTRNSIDRFKGGASNKSLFTEKYCYDGTTTLRVKIDKDVDAKTFNAFCACVCDLNNGLLSVGGEASVGRGIFKVEKVNGWDVVADELFDHLKGEY